MPRRGGEENRRRGGRRGEREKMERRRASEERVKEGCRGTAGQGVARLYRPSTGTGTGRTAWWPLKRARRMRRAAVSRLRRARRCTLSCPPPRRRRQARIPGSLGRHSCAASHLTAGVRCCCQGCCQVGQCAVVEEAVGGGGGDGPRVAAVRVSRLHMAAAFDAAAFDGSDQPFRDSLVTRHRSQPQPTARAMLRARSAALLPGPFRPHTHAGASTPRWRRPRGLT
jgi:hypothetical protein